MEQLLHKYVPPPLAVSETESPGQITVLPPGVMAGVGGAIEVMLKVSFAVPQLLVDVTE